MTREFAETLNRMVKGGEDDASQPVPWLTVVLCAAGVGVGCACDPEYGLAYLFGGMIVFSVLLLVHSFLDQKPLPGRHGRVGTLSTSEREQARTLLRRASAGK